MKDGARGEDKVNVTFIGSCAIFNATVKHIPTEPGDFWILWTETGEIIHVQHFETISVLNRKANEQRKE